MREEFDRALASLEWQIATDCASRGIVPVAREHAPSDLQALRWAVHALRIDPFGTYMFIPVWSGASDRTIWSSPAANWRFRAWHDAQHLELRAEFDPAGERTVARLALRRTLGTYCRRILWAEVWGQIEHFQRFGVFPTDQSAFVRACFVLGHSAALARGPY